MERSTWIISLVGRLSCRKEDKNPVFQTVKKLVDHIKLVRRDGLLALEDVMDAERDPFLKNCLRYLLEVSPEPEDFWEYGTVCLSIASETGAQLLQKAVIVDGLLLLLHQTPPRAAFLRLSAWLGEEFSMEVEAELLAMDEAAKQRYRETCEKRAKSVVPEFDALEELSDELLPCFAEIDSQTLAVALLGASGAVYDTIKHIFPPVRWKELEQLMGGLHPIRAYDADHAQRQVLALLPVRGGVL